MAGPLLPIGLLVAGMLANDQANRAVEKERQRRIQAENLRQRQLGSEADARLRQELETQSRPAVEAEKQQAVAGREAKYEQALPSAEVAAYQTTPTAPKEVKSEIARSMVAAIQRGRQQGKALAKLGGQGDANFAGAVDLTRGAQDLNRIGGQSRASSAILPYELQDANSKGEGWRTIGDVANLASMAYGLYGMTSAPKVASTGGYGLKTPNLYSP